MLVRIKKEIIAFGVESVVPEQRTSPKLSARELKRWLDEGKPVQLLDVRNDYEIQLGTFHNAQHLNIHHFRDFPRALSNWPRSQLAQAAKDQPLVMFCTGGIRCEKAGPLMEQAGFTNVYQLDGGILKYFEEVGGDHWRGDCFVFDGRVALNPQLQPSGDQLCFACQHVLKPEDLASKEYLLGEHCPYCYVEPAARIELKRQQLEHVIRDQARLQLGCQPYDNFRKIRISSKFTGQRLGDFLREYQPAVDPQLWHQAISEGLLTYHGKTLTADQIVVGGQQLIHHQPGTVEPAINPEIGVIYEDESLLVVDKPAPLPTHPSGRYNLNSLTSILQRAFPNRHLRVAHRLDSNTTGVVVLCCKLQASRFVQPQFDSGSVTKVYLARVHGHPSWEKYCCQVPISDAVQPGGARQLADNDQSKLDCITHFKVIDRLTDGSSLIQAIPQTGRTHQIRLHLFSLGLPIVGDLTYGVDGQIFTNQTLSVDQSPMCLFAQSLMLVHPVSKQPITFTATSPPWISRE
jgi:RluA family pseudouridine synthase